MIKKLDLNAKFVYDFFKLVYTYTYQNVDIGLSEATYSHGLVWSIMELAVQDYQNTKFHPGEYLLESTVEEYKADGVISFNGIEFGLLVGKIWSPR